MSEKEYKQKTELMFKKNTVLINQLAEAKEIIREFLQHYNAKTIYVENMKSLLNKAEDFIKENK